MCNFGDLITIVMIAVVYLGSSKFRNYTRINHENLFNQLRSNWPITVYDYTDSAVNWAQWPVCDNHELQEVWSFMEVSQRLSEKVIIKLCTDVWFTPVSQNVVVQEVQNVAQGSNDVCFIGMELSEDFAVDYQKITVSKTVKIQDTVIIASTPRINPSDTAMLALQHDHKAVSRQRAYRHIVPKNGNAVSVHTQLPLVCDDRLPTNDYDITLAYVNAVGNRAPKARMFWTLKQPPKG